MFTTTRFTLTPHWGAQAFYGHAITNDFPVSSAQRFDIVAYVQCVAAGSRTR